MVIKSEINSTSKVRVIMPGKGKYGIWGYNYPVHSNQNYIWKKTLRPF